MGGIHLQRPRAESQSSARTSSSESEDIELICYNELLENGGRPVVPIEVLSRESKGSCEKDLPWLDDPGSRNRDGGMPIVFSRQADRWWEFLKWQLDNRGPPAVGNDRVSAYLAARKRRHLQSGSHDMVSNSTSFEMAVRREWEMRPKLLEVPSNAGFPAYKEAVKKRLASHNFNREFQLEDDPRQQGVWTTWVEYLNFEYWQADRLAASLKTSEQRYRNAWNALQCLNTRQPSSLGRVAVPSSKDSPANAPPCLEQQLATTQADLAALRQKMNSFIRETRPYRRTEEDARRQNILTRWVLEQLHVIEAEAAQERTVVKNDQGKALPSKKRRRQTEDKEAEVENIPAERSSKRLRRGDASGGGTTQHSTPGWLESSRKATISTDLATTVPKGMTRKLHQPCRHVSDKQTNANAAAQRSQRSSQRSRATAGQSTSHGQRQSKRLQARS